MRTLGLSRGGLWALATIPQVPSLGYRFACLLSLGSPRSTVTSASGTPIMSRAPVWYLEYAASPFSPKYSITCWSSAGPPQSYGWAPRETYTVGAIAEVL